MFHSGKVCICIATVSTEFRVDANSCYLIDNRKIKPGIFQSTRAEHDTKKKIIIINVYYMQSTVELMRCRSLLPGASIFHTHPLSQPCSVSFLFLEAPPTGFIVGVYKTANHKTHSEKE